jgi:hypothetical protein
MSATKRPTAVDSMRRGVGTTRPRPPRVSGQTRASDDRRTSAVSYHRSGSPWT